VAPQTSEDGRNHQQRDAGLEAEPVVVPESVKVETTKP
jgi:hypothetical protein